jgi:hypothetical protein
MNGMTECCGEHLDFGMGERFGLEERAADYDSGERGWVGCYMGEIMSNRGLDCRKGEGAIWPMQVS